MNYQAYQTYSEMMAPVRLLMRASAAVSRAWLRECPALGELAEAYESVSALEVTHVRPDFSLSSVQTGRGRKPREVAVHEEAVHVAPFGTLLHFRKERVKAQPRVLMIAPMSGHFASRLRDTARTMLRDHDLYITDWHNARDVPLAAGRFGLDDYVSYLIDFLEVIGPGAHVVAVCQSCVGALAAVALMAADRNPAQPRSLTLMGGPIDPRIKPTRVNHYATTTSIEWFESNVISTVPSCHAGAMRRVYPGFMQLPAFMDMNLKCHAHLLIDLYRGFLECDPQKANAARAFYDEYFAVMDLAAEFYLETIRDVFQQPALPQGRLRWCGRTVDPACIRRTALLTVEGEHDEICSAGQTEAAQGLCTGIPQRKKRHYLQPGVGHDGVFSGPSWAEQIYPVVREMIRSSQ